MKTKPIKFLQHHGPHHHQSPGVQTEGASVLPGPWYAWGWLCAPAPQGSGAALLPVCVPSGLDAQLLEDPPVASVFHADHGSPPPLLVCCDGEMEEMEGNTEMEGKTRVTGGVDVRVCVCVGGGE